MSEILQQTLFMETGELSECTEKDEEGENYIQTNFDLMVSDFCNEIIEDDHVILGKTFAINPDKMYCIIQYMKKPSELSIAKTVIDGM